MLCIDDFLTGSCTCLTNEQLEAKEIELSQKLIELSNNLVSMIENKQKDVKKIYNEITSLENQIKDIQSSRKIHYTELGMKPFNQQYEEYKHEKSKQVEIKKENDLKIGSITGQVIKVTKFGKK